MTKPFGEFLHRKDYHDYDPSFDGKPIKQLRETVSHMELPISEEISDNDLNEIQQKTLELMREFSGDLGHAFKIEFLRLLDKYSETKPISKKIIDFVQEKNLTLPTFRITQGKASGELLKEFGLDKDYTNYEGFVLTLKLPSPLAQYWWKGGQNFWGSKNEAQDVGIDVIEWGYFYRELMKVVWAMLGYYDLENDFSLRKINAKGQHDPSKYYYVLATRDDLIDYLKKEVEKLKG